MRGSNIFQTAYLITMKNLGNVYFRERPGDCVPLYSEYSIYVETEHILMYVSRERKYIFINLILNKNIKIYYAFRYCEYTRKFCLYAGPDSGYERLSENIVKLLMKMNFSSIYKNKAYKDCIEYERLIRNVVYRMYIK